jgi:hypothetical protein
LFLKFRRLGLDDAKVMSKTNLPHIRVRPAVGIGDERYLGAALVERCLFRCCRLEEESVEGTHHALTVCRLSPKAAVVSVRRRIHACHTLSPKAAVVSVRRRIHACHTLSPKAAVVSVRRRIHECHTLSPKAAVVSVRRRIHACHTLSPKAAVVSVRRRIHACHTLSPKAAAVSARRACHKLSPKAAMVSVPSSFSHLHHMLQTRLNTEEYERQSPGALYTCIHPNI